VGTSNLKKARAFYDRVLGILDMSPLFHEPSEVIYGKTNPEFQISTKTHDKRALTVGNSNCVGFWAGRREDVDAVFAEAIKAGGTSVSGPTNQGNHMYHCVIRDLDGNFLKIMFWLDNPEKPTG
jgi:predicted lactoylglutathione lyase